ncbi:MAG: AmmeMemoRadiSam system protein B [Patescibacteria group bacterium]|nr:AmmeMemoRadiSam system protein B [Patescibacteria group bacterium]
MALVFTAIAAHTPVLIPSIGKGGLDIIKSTKSAMERLEQDLYIAQPDVLIVISPHGDTLPDAITINMNAKYVSNFEEFGDLVTKMEWKPAMMLMDRLREDFKTSDLQMAMNSQDELDYGTSVPLYYLTQHVKDINVIPIVPSSKMDLKTHYEFGKKMKGEIIKSTERIAVVASADLSHRVSEKSPDGLSPKGVAFDEKVIEVLREHNPVGILDIDEAWMEEASTCSARALAMMFGVLDGVHHEAEILSYEKPLGVGYLVASIRVS